ncbi:MAG: hypothetical protein LQ339_007330 [Xanthoria mediterranea]|nr:MAG: hypothetical protein LQ339_007330 [Xanthoria mediterranea]
MYQSPSSFSSLTIIILLLLLTPFSTPVNIQLTHQVTLLPPYGNGDIVSRCTNLAPGICCLAPRGTGADHVLIQHLTLFDIAALWQSRRETANPISPWQPLQTYHTDCSGRVVDSRNGPGDWQWDRWREGRLYESPSIHGASFITMPRALPPDGKAKVWMAVEGLLGLAWGSGEWFVNEAAQKAFAGGSGGAAGSGGVGGRKLKRGIVRAEKTAKAYARPPLRAVFPDVVELGEKRYVGNGDDGVMYTDAMGLDQFDGDP